jgi:hypothetical protein
VLDMSAHGDAADVNPVIKFLTHKLQHLAVDSSDCQMLQLVCQELDYRIYICASPRVDISSTCKLRQKLGGSLPLLICSPSL